MPVISIPYDAIAYTSQQWREIQLDTMNTSGAASECVLANVGNQLSLSVSTNTITVATGSAVVAGAVIRNTTALPITVTVPAATTGGHVVIESDITAKVGNIKFELNTSGVTTPPTLTQSAAKWQVRLATFTITNTGVITLTDVRGFVHFGTRVSNAMMDTGAVGTANLIDASVTTVKQADGSTTTAKLADASVTTVKLADANVTTAKLADANVTTAKLADANVTTAKLADASVTAPKLASGVAVSNIGYTPVNKAGDTMSSALGIAPTTVQPPFVLGSNALTQLVTGLNADTVDGLNLALNRQGGSASAWRTTGTTNYTPTSIRTQAGASSVSIANAATTGTLTVNFPVSFSAEPLIYVTFVTNFSPGTSDSWTIAVESGSIAVNTFNIRVARPASGSAYSIQVNWFAIGPI